VVAALLDHGADALDITPDGMTSLMLAVNAIKPEVVKVLLERSSSTALVDAVDNMGMSALQLLSSREMILASLCDRQRARQSVDIARLLLENKSNIEAVDPKGYTALLYACANNRKPLVQLLLEHKADIHATATDEQSSSTALKLACVNPDVGSSYSSYLECASAEIVSLLLADLRATTAWVNAAPHGVSALSVAIENQDAASVNALVKAGADLYQVERTQQDDGWVEELLANKVLLFAVKAGDAELVRTVLDALPASAGAGAGVGSSDGATVPALDVTAALNSVISHTGHNKPDIFNLLLDTGADCNKAGSDAYAALHRACISGQLEAVQLLLEHGADINAAAVGDGGALTPLMCAVEAGHVKVMKLLLARLSPD
jgi:ankyrin repeat protein